MLQFQQASCKSAGFAIGRGEFIAMIAALMAINALAIDVMLPGMQQIGASLGEPDENQRQLIITAYLLGFSVMQLAFGPLSDRYGRRGPLAAGIAVYVLAAIGAMFVPTFAPLLGIPLHARAWARRPPALSRSRLCVMCLADGRWRRSCRWS